MTTANAWHQSNYRKSLPGKKMVRLDVVIGTEAKAAIERLAKLYGMSQGEIIERVMYDAEHRVMADSQGSGESWSWIKIINRISVTL